MNNKIKLMASGVLLCFGSNSFAELYISPIVREPSKITITNEAPAEAHPAVVLAPSPTAPVQGTASSSIVANTKVTKPVSSPAVVEAKKTNGLFGKSVPLQIAAANLVPSKYWTVNIEEGINDRFVSWENAANYQEAFSQIEKSGNIFVTVNSSETSVGLARTKSMADILAKRNPNVYVIKPELSLRKNLEAWASKAGWTVRYQDGLKADYDGLSVATLTVPFEGKGGAADQLLKGTWDKNVPLMGQFKSGNRTLVVLEKGYQRVNALESKY